MHRKESHKRLRRADPLGYLLKELKKNAKKRGSDFSLTKNDLLPAPTHCPVFGVLLEYTGNGGPNSASFDRSDSSKGYVPGNVVIMSKRANLLKNNATADELQKVVDYLRRHADAPSARGLPGPLLNSSGASVGLIVTGESAPSSANR